MDLDVAGKGYLLVGATSGMGMATAHVLAADGAALVLVGRDRERADRAVANIVAAQPVARVSAVCGDVSSASDVERCVAEAVETLGGLDGVGVFTGTLGHEPIDMPDDHWMAAFEDVLLGTVRVVRTVLPHLVARGGGTLVTTAAYSIHDPQAARLPYGALKGGVAVFTKGVAKAYGKHGVRANCVCPGAIETEALHALRGVLSEARGIPYDETLERVMVDDWGMHVALGRPGQPHEVGELVAFLLSPKAGYLTGALVNIDGGTDF